LIKSIKVGNKTDAQMLADLEKKNQELLKQLEAARTAAPGKGQGTACCTIF